MTISISSEAFENKPRKLENERLYKKKQKNGQSELLLSRCLLLSVDLFWDILKS